MLPLITVPISRKVIAQFIAAGIATALAAVNVYEVPPAWTAFIATGAGLVAGVIVGEGAKYVNYAAERLGLPIRVSDQD